jgi:hypothetical protein
MLPFQQFSRYWQAVLDLPTQDRYYKAQLCCEQFLLFSQLGLDVYYIPFHHLNIKARIVLLGLTPGWTQMERAFWAVKKGLADGLEGEALFSYVGKTASFSGPMRKNLVEMLDRIGLSGGFGIKSCADLFVDSNHLVHFTSVVSAPIFKAGGNYAGLNPRLLKVSALRTFVLEHLAQELTALPQAIIVPLGKVASEAIEFLHKNKLITPDRCLSNFPHPSGANGHRKPIFEHGRRRWQGQLSAWFADDGTNRRTNLQSTAEQT